jgi:hypothetical protein
MQKGDQAGHRGSLSSIVRDKHGGDAQFLLNRGFGLRRKAFHSISFVPSQWNRAR